MQDSNPFAFPHSTTAANAVTSTYGSVFAKDLVFNRGMQVISKADNTACTASNYTYARTSDGTVNEFARQTFGLDAGLTTGTYALQMLRKNGAVTTIDEAVAVDHTQMLITSTSSTDASLASTCSINYSGLQFGSDTSSIYFGSQQVSSPRMFVNTSTLKHTIEHLLIESFLYLHRLQQFRIIFGLGDAPQNNGNTLSIQAKQPDGSYANAVQYTDRTG